MRNTVDFMRHTSVAVLMEKLPIDTLRHQWRQAFGWSPPPSTKRSFLEKNLHYHQQAQQHGGLKNASLRQLQDIAAKASESPAYIPTPNALYKPGTLLVRTYKGKPHEVVIAESGFSYNGEVYTSLSAIARHITGTAWNGHTFFGLKGKSCD